MAKRKARALTRTTRQIGSSNLAKDRKRRAIAPGKRVSKNGKIYYEYRKNRSDVKGVDRPAYKKTKNVVRKAPVKINLAKTKATLTREKKMRIYAQYRRNEDRNAHTENAVMLIRLFGTPAQIKKAMSIQKAHMKRGSITKTEADWLLKYGHSHYNKIKPTITKSKVRKSTTITFQHMKEPLRGVRRHDLLPKSVRARIPKLYSQDGKKDPTVYVKFFSPYSNYTLYVTEFDGRDTLFGYAATGQGSEWGYSSFNELVKANKGGLPLIERDKYFSPKPASKISAIPKRK